MDKTGVVYILTHPSFPEYVKIGYTGNIDKRLQQRNRSKCIPPYLPCLCNRCKALRRKPSCGIGLRDRKNKKL